MDRVQYSPNELEITGSFPLGALTNSAGVPNPAPPKHATPVTPRDNYLATLAKEKPLWIPKGGDTTFIAPRVVPDNVARAFVFERDSLKPEELVGGPDMFGTPWVYVPVAGGSMVQPGNPRMDDVNNWKSIVEFPDIDSWDWAGSAEKNAELIGDKGRGMVVWQLNGMYERLISLMDFEGAAMAMIDDDQKEALHEFYGALADLYIAMVKKYKEFYNLDTYYFHDDWGSQRAPFFSLATAREMLVPHMRKITDACHEMGIFVEFHCCGKNEMLVPAMIEAGYDVWNGQPMNDKVAVHKEYGDKIIIGFGTADLGLTPTSTEEEIIAVAKKFVEDFGPTFDERPVVATGMFPKFNETIYEMSRQMFA